MTEEEFEEIADKVVENLPDSIASALDNTLIVVKDYPGEEAVGFRDKGTLLGLYSGYSTGMIPNRSATYPAPPSFIYVYQDNIERYCRTEDEIKRQIKTTIIHEIGHHVMGMSDRQLMEEYGL